MKGKERDRMSKLWEERKERERERERGEESFNLFGSLRKKKDNCDISNSFIGTL